MLSKCANPSCSTELVYLREGKIFMMEASAQPKAAEAPAPKPAIEHFWLCGPCSEQLTVAYDRQNGVQVVQKKFRTMAAAS